MKPKGKPNSFSKLEVYSFFKNLSSTEETGETYEAETEIPGDTNLVQDIDNILNNRFRLDEVKMMINKLKTGKAAGVDKIISELLKNLADSVLHIVVRILNKIFDSGEFPDEWAAGIIVILFKGGAKIDLNNYRGITLLSVVGKLLVGILNEQLTKLVEKYNVVNENQAGFRKGYRTTDHIFTLNAIISHTINVKKKRLFVCFIDFKKAFDKVSHSILWQKLIHYGIEGKFLTIVKSMYAKVRSCVRSNEGLTEFFPYRRGLRQGWLFTQFLNDLNTFLLKEAPGITIWDIRVCAMLYADDLILLADSEDDLQRQMNALGIYADLFKMEVNQKNAKVLVFNKPRQIKKHIPKVRSIGSIPIEEDCSYKYLRVIFSNNGSFNEHTTSLKEKADKAYYSIVSKSKEWQGFNPKTFFISLTIQFYQL